MRILLTGGAGYVGSACLRWLLRHGHDPLAYDDLSEGNAAAVPAERLLRGDILDGKTLAATLRERRIDAVMHFAALASVPKSIDQPEAYWRTNVLGTKCLLDAMLASNVKILLFSSTAATYSFDAPMPLAEDSPQVPQVPYGTTKLAAEHIIRDYARAHGLGYAILRYFNAAGADPDGGFGEHRREETHLVPLILYAALGKRRKVFIYGTDWPTRDGSCVRDYVHTDDLALAHQLAVEGLRPGMGRIFNVGSGTGTTVLEALRACERVVGRPIPQEIVARRPGDPAVLVASPAKLERELGWQPRFPRIDEIVETAWRWHHGHPDGYARR
ncbi:MAG: UDP-glucose 4-epimerase GalE [Planctomycetes bacterium]|nr:UDP-glucose 4-epimerase GalE [Planctomycetota bacterium]